jgi:hypothetical protein
MSDSPAKPAMPPLVPTPTPVSPVTAQAPAPVQPTQQSAQEPDALTRAVDEWVREQLGNSPVSRDTEAWNHVQKVIPDLVNRIRSAR